MPRGVLYKMQCRCIDLFGRDQAAHWSTVQYIDAVVPEVREQGWAGHAGGTGWSEVGTSTIFSPVAVGTCPGGSAAPRSPASRWYIQHGMYVERRCPFSTGSAPAACPSRAVPETARRHRGSFQVSLGRTIMVIPIPLCLQDEHENRRSGGPSALLPSVAYGCTAAPTEPGVSRRASSEQDLSVSHASRTNLFRNGISGA
nr:hypothetical protein CFP56_34802 [Quercus suber]